MFFFQAEDGLRDLVRSRGLGDVYKRQDLHGGNVFYERDGRAGLLDWQLVFAGCWAHDMSLSLIHI